MPSAVSDHGPVAGDYFAGERELYYVERVTDGRALLEDCRTGMLVDLTLAPAADRPRSPAASARTRGHH